MSQRIIVEHHAIDRFRKRIDPLASYDEAKQRITALAHTAKVIRQRAVNAHYWDAGECILVVRSDRYASTNARVVVTVLSRDMLMAEQAISADDDLMFEAMTPARTHAADAPPPTVAPSGQSIAVVAPAPTSPTVKCASRLRPSGKRVETAAIREARLRDAERGRRHAFTMLFEQTFKLPMVLSVAFQFMRERADAGDARATEMLAEMNMIATMKDRIRKLPIHVLDAELDRLVELARQHGVLDAELSAGFDAIRARVGDGVVTVMKL